MKSQYHGKETEESSLKSLNEKVDDVKAVDKVGESISEKMQNNVVASLAEKAMSVAAPVVPTNEDGEVDQDRLVAMLADLGQKGGLLRLVGKAALLWGGLRGATSLTDKLISFLRMAERPLYQRIFGFVGMVLVLWSPILVPLLPTLVRSWTTSNPSRFAYLVSIIGLYTAVMILVMLWGRRIRGYEDPLEEYGLDFMKPHKIKFFFMGLIGGIMLVLSIQSVNVLLGCASFSRPASLPTSSDAIACLKVCGQVIMLAGRGIITATGLVLVEELLFRSWLPEEIATDLGYHQGIIISGLAFSLVQRSPLAIPGLWLLSLALAGLRQRSEGSLSIPIGLHAGITASSFILQTGGFFTYKPNYPLWITGTHSFQPFSGVVGLAFSALLAIVLYPREPLKKKKTVRE